MAWWDFIFQVETPFGTWLFSQLGISGIYDLTITSLQVLTDLLVYLMTLFMYFPARLFATGIDLLNIVLASVAGLINVIIDSGNVILETFTGIWSGVWPGPWVALLGIIIVLNVALRIYYFVKDIHILGNSV
jgi:hypothetical protein